MKMSGVLRLSLLITVAAQLSIASEEKVGNFDRIITVCSEDRMEIHIRKDFDEFRLKGEELECQGEYGNFTEYDGNVIRVKSWSLPLTKGDGPCGLKFGPVEGSDLTVHETTIYASDKDRSLRCVRTGMLDKRGAEIRLETMTPKVAGLRPRGKDTVVVPKRTTVSAYFHHRFPETAGLSLHPIQCWLINERKQSRRLVIDNGCPLYGKGRRPIVALGSESADEVTGDEPHVFFNAESVLFPEEDPADLPSFRLQCTVMPCKGGNLFQQIVGIPRCPAIAWCQVDRKMNFKPTDIFEINQEFSVTISSSLPAITNKEYRALREPIYPGEYWMDDSRDRTAYRTAEKNAPKEDCVEKDNTIWYFAFGALALLSILAAILFLVLTKKGHSLTKYIHKQVTIARLTAEDGMRPEKLSTTYLVADEYDMHLQEQQGDRCVPLVMAR